MADIDINALENRLAQLQGRIEIADRFNDINLVRSYVAEAALAYVISGREVDFDTIERVMLEELGTADKRGDRVKSAVASLRQRVGDPTIAYDD